MIVVVVRELLVILMGMAMAAVQRGTKKSASRVRATAYLNRSKILFRMNDRVRLNKKALVLYKKLEGELFAGREIKQTRIKYLFPDVKGLVRLETRLGGYWTWSVDDLEKAE